MKTSKLTVAAAILGGFSLACRADSDSSINASATTPQLYQSQEVSLDAFAAGSVHQQTIDHITGDRITHDGRVGGGLGLNYFFCRYLGIGADAYTENMSRTVIGSSSGNLIARFPIGESGFAPYIFGGGGYQFSEATGFAQAGGGLEFRFTRHLGCFVDARYNFAVRTENYAVGRAGLRFTF